MAKSCRRESFLLFVLSAVWWGTANAFVVVPTVPSVSALQYKHKDNNDHLFGDAPGEQVPSGLQERLQDLQRQETRYAAIEGRNWNQANWKVNGIPWNATVTSVMVAHNEDDTPMLLVGDDTGTVTCLQWITNGVPSQSIMEEDAPIDYEIVQQWTMGGSVRLLAADEEYVYASDGAVIHQWEWDEDGEANREPTATMAHSCHTVQAIPDQRLVSVHAQGIHIWRDGSLLGEYKTEEMIGCAAVDDEKVYLGMVNGDIAVHSLQQILDGDSPALARWSGTRDDSLGISALAVGGDTRIGSQMVQVLFAGDTNGGVKQWFLLPQGKGDSLQPWPKLPTQRLPKKAHVFPGHIGRVQNILAVDGVKFVSSSVDATGTFPPYFEAPVSAHSLLLYSFFSQGMEYSNRKRNLFHGGISDRGG